ncbi:hypothetical protein PIB30_089846, partial [Stylosanthes scabra]|nr:hypothetical protein [Stylosanthes scabra]
RNDLIRLRFNKIRNNVIILRFNKLIFFLLKLQPWRRCVREVNLQKEASFKVFFINEESDFDLHQAHSQFRLQDLTMAAPSSPIQCDGCLSFRFAVNEIERPPLKAHSTSIVPDHIHISDDEIPRADMCFDSLEEARFNKQSSERKWLKRARGTRRSRRKAWRPNPEPMRTHPRGLCVCIAMTWASRPS